MEITTNHYLVLSFLLFSIGIFGIVTRRNMIIVLMSIELVLNSVNLNLMAFSYQHSDLTGQIFAVFTICASTFLATSFWSESVTSSEIVRVFFNGMWGRRGPGRAIAMAATTTAAPTATRSATGAATRRRRLATPR